MKPQGGANGGDDRPSKPLLATEGRRHGPGSGPAQSSWLPGVLGTGGPVRVACVLLCRWPRGPLYGADLGGDCKTAEKPVRSGPWGGAVRKPGCCRFPGPAWSVARPSGAARPRGPCLYWCLLQRRLGGRVAWRPQKSLCALPTRGGRVCLFLGPFKLFIFRAFKKKHTHLSPRLGPMPMAH